MIVHDPTDDGLQPTGKQSVHPVGIFYTDVSGSWQAVWLEPVNPAYIRRIRLIPDIHDSTISIFPDISSEISG